MVVVLAAVVVVVAVVTRVLACPGWGALGAWDWAWAWARARLPGVVMEPCIFTGGSRDCWPYSIYCTHRIWTNTGRRTYSSRKYHPQPTHCKSGARIQMCRELHLNPNLTTKYKKPVYLL